MAVPQNSTVRWFTSDMVGAPQLTATPGSIIAILDACLINGFGTATPDGNKITVSGGVATVEFSGGNTFEKYAVIEIEGATPSELNDVWRITATTATTFSFDCPGIPDGTATGSITVKRATPGYWEKTFGDSLKTAYRSIHPDSNGMFLRIDDSLPVTDPFCVPIRGYQSMTDIDTGVGEFPKFSDRPADLSSNTHLWPRIYQDNQYSNPGHWAVIADERFFYYLPFHYYRTGAGLHQFGDLSLGFGNDAFNTVTTAHYRKPNDPEDYTSSYELSGPGYQGCYFAASQDGIESGVRYYRRGSEDIKMPSGNFTAPTYPHPASGGYLLHNVLGKSQDGSLMVYRGVVPGLYQIDLNLNGHFTEADRFVPIDPGLGLESPVLIVRAIGASSNWTTCYYAAFDIGGPWR
ncbi:hypothetical protein [Marinobacter nauticus]|uniref:hypothetical protein n=1 Tax=Marinobacter nauticus TaxID=2743 RepID=UPI001C96600D|nr:hypothetical protein [Marinobacter nauticus]MBY6102295.1 hypothetical protein [Marinobacter nauticus]